jgi:hypothetical protein
MKTAIVLILMSLLVSLTTLAHSIPPKRISPKKQCKTIGIPKVKPYKPFKPYGVAFG